MDQPRSLVEHLEELRRRLWICIIAVGIGSIIVYCFVPFFLRWISKPLGTLVFTSLAEPFLVSLRIAFIGGLFLASPICLYQLWAFVVVGLKAREKHWIYAFFPISLGLFLTGLAFAICIVLPFVIRFFLSFSHTNPNLQPMISLSQYLSFWSMLVFLFGLIFQIPLIILFLSITHLVKPKQMARHRGVIVVGIFIIAAILTPPDVVSQLLMAIPMWVLFELGLFMARFVRKN